MCPGDGVAGGLSQTREGVKAFKGADQEGDVVDGEVLDQHVVDGGAGVRDNLTDERLVGLVQAQLGKNVKR